MFIGGAGLFLACALCTCADTDQGGGTGWPRLAFDQRTNYEVNCRLIDEASPIIIEGCNLYLRGDVLAVRRVRGTRLWPAIPTLR